MYDSVRASMIPFGAVMVAGYVDGPDSQWSAADWARFPDAVKVRIATNPTTAAGQVLDCENGDATPADAPGWVLRARARGVDPTVYCSEANWPQAFAAFAATGVAQPHYWIAAYPGIGQNLYPGTVAHQYVDTGPYDLSVVADYWPGVDNAEGASAMNPEQADAICALVEDLSMYMADFTRWPESDVALESNANPMASAILAGSRARVEAILAAVPELKTSLAARQSALALTAAFPAFQAELNATLAGLQGQITNLIPEAPTTDPIVLQSMVALEVTRQIGARLAAASASNA